MLVAFSVTPLGVGEAVAEYVADAVRVVRGSGLPNQTDAMFTTVEGDWDEVMDVVKRAVEAVAAKAPRVSLTLKADVRPGRAGRWSPRSRPWSATSAPDLPLLCWTCLPGGSRTACIARAWIHAGFCGHSRQPGQVRANIAVRISRIVSSRCPAASRTRCLPSFAGSSAAACRISPAWNSLLMTVSGSSQAARSLAGAATPAAAWSPGRRVRVTSRITATGELADLSWQRAEADLSRKRGLVFPQPE